MTLKAEPILESGPVKTLLSVMGHGLRRYQQVVVEEVSKLVGEGGVVIAELPTGYGKTLIPVTLAAHLVTEGVVGRVIHTYPATSMIEHLLRKRGSELEALRGVWLKELGVEERASRLLVGARHMFRHESPMLTNPYVVTTLDTLVAHYLKTSFARLSRASARGIYSEFSAGVIHTSLLVFDEAHMYPVITEDGEEAPTLGKAFNVMAHIMGRHAEVGGVSLLMTATLPEPLLHGLEEALARYGVVPRVIKYEEGADDSPEREGSFLSEVRKRSYDVELKEMRSRGELIKELANHAAKLAREGRRVLAVLNTVEDAVRAYLMIREGVGRIVPVVLAHSRFTLSDRERIVGEISKAAEPGGGSVVVATQVVEASIDISMDALLTDVAPLDSIAQRLGRVCRPGHIRGECVGVVRIYASTNELRGGKECYGPYDTRLVKASLEALKEMRDSGWKGFSEFTVTPKGLISEAYEEAYAPVLLPHDKLLDFLEGLTVRTSPALIEEWVHEEFGGFVRNEDLALAVLVDRAAIHEYLEGGEEGGERVREAVANAVREGSIIKVRLGTLMKILEKAGVREVPVAWVSLGGVTIGRVRTDQERLMRTASRGGAYLVIPEDLYDSELGLTLREGVGEA